MYLTSTPIATRRRRAGFTLIELVITLAVIGIVVVVALPSFQGFVLDNRLSAQTNDLVADLMFARSEAIKRSSNVLVCVKEANAEACDSTAPEWRLNRVVWVDADNDGIIDADEVLRRRGLIEGGNVLLTSNIPTTLTFRRDGFSNVAVPATGLPSHFKLCDRRKNAFARAIVVDRTGRVRTSREADFLTDATKTNFIDCPSL